MREFAVAWAPTKGRTQQCEMTADVDKKKTLEAIESRVAHDGTILEQS
jgi:hypothetical protein